MSKKRRAGRKRNPRSQAVTAIRETAAFGQSKFLAKRGNGGKPPRDKTYAKSTIRQYQRICARALTDVAAVIGRKPNIGEYWTACCLWLELCILRRLAADTIRTYACALAKMFRCGMHDFGVNVPAVDRGKYTKNRINWYALYYDPAKYPEIELVAKATGIRRMSFLCLSPRQVMRRPNGEVYLCAVKCKGGQICDIPVLPRYADEIWKLAQQKIAEGANWLTPKPPSAAPIHQYRTRYARELYDLVARPIEKLSPKEIYCSKGELYDRAALLYVSEALSHHRPGVTLNYLRRDFITYSTNELYAMRDAKRRKKEEDKRLAEAFWDLVQQPKHDMWRERNSNG